MKQILGLLVVLFVFILSGQQSPVYAADASTNGGTPVPRVQQGVGQAVGDGYVIGKGDVLRITVWREPMLSGTALVRSDGMVTMGLLGDVRAAGRTPMDLQAEIQRRLKEYVQAPVVTVAVRTATSQKFYVIGEVKTPGEYALAKDMTVVQAIARAGGFTEWASKDDIILIRNENGAVKRIKVNYKNIVNGEDSSDPELKANDTVIVR